MPQPSPPPPDTPDGSNPRLDSSAEEARKRCVIDAARQRAAEPARSQAETCSRSDSDTGTGSGYLEVRCPICHAPMEVAFDTQLTDLTCTACGSHFSLVDQSQATRMAPSLTQMGRFELIERIGVGGFGSVWKARDKQLDRTVAVKIPRAGGMSPEDQEKFFREARAADQLKHASIVSVHEVGRDGDSIYIVSDFVRGVTLGDWLTGQRLTGREAAELCAKIADALHHAHEKGVIHRDLKPANIMIDGDGQPQLMDFGLARRMIGEVTMTLDGQIIGTPAYMSPEQALGEAHSADRRSDLYSLGVILYQMLTSELPFRGNARMLVYQLAHDEPPSPRQFNATIHKDLEIDLEQKGIADDAVSRNRQLEQLTLMMRELLGPEMNDLRRWSYIETTLLNSEPSERTAADTARIEVLRAIVQFRLGEHKASAETVRTALRHWHEAWDNHQFADLVTLEIATLTGRSLAQVAAKEIDKKQLQGLVEDVVAAWRSIDEEYPDDYDRFGVMIAGESFALLGSDEVAEPLLREIELKFGMSPRYPMWHRRSLVALASLLKRQGRTDEAKELMKRESEIIEPPGTTGAAFE